MDNNTTNAVSAINKALSLQKALNDFTREDSIQGMAQANKWFLEASRRDIIPGQGSIENWNYEDINIQYGDLEAIFKEKPYNSNDGKARFTSALINLGKSTGHLGGTADE